jgi:TrmH family RNA methyltransferase
MLIDGPRALSLALQNNFRLEAIYFTQDTAPQYTHLLQQASQKKTILQPVSAAVFNKIGYGDNPAGILGLAPQPSFSLSQLPQSENPLYIVTEGLEKPGNLGAILRSADAAGVTGLIVCNSQTDIYNPNVIRASRGAFFTVPLVQVGSEEVVCWLHENRIQILAASPAADQLYTEVDLRQPIALVLGSEHSGLTNIWLQQTLIRVPMIGQVDSLNVAQTASILMFEAVRQRTVN